MLSTEKNIFIWLFHINSASFQSPSSCFSILFLRPYFIILLVHVCSIQYNEKNSSWGVDACAYHILILFPSHSLPSILYFECLKNYYDDLCPDDAIQITLYVRVFLVIAQIITSTVFMLMYCILRFLHESTYQ